jgi:LPXTG-motif cell wall-anchored protein
MKVFATIKRSIPMLTLAYIFFVVMFLGDLIVGVLQKNNSLIVGGLVMILIASALIFLINKKK